MDFRHLECRLCRLTSRNEDIKKMLDSNKDNLKLTAMRRVIAVKKLVYAYLTRYAEEQQDLALLSVSTFQRSLKDANQLVRASALRVLSSIRISVIAPILMLAVRDGAVDLSPYVRKTVAHAIPKLYSLDPEEKEPLVEVISKLFEDNSTIVVGSAVQAFEDVCPERLDLVHKHYRKLCNLLMDVDEWGQIAIINMLTRYARAQFPNPKTCLESAAAVSMSRGDATLNIFHSKSAPPGEDRACAGSLREGEDDDDDYDDNDIDGSGSERSKKKRSGCSIDPAVEAMLRADYHLLITASRLLLFSHNAAVSYSEKLSVFWHLSVLTCPLDSPGGHRCGATLLSLRTKGGNGGCRKGSHAHSALHKVSLSLYFFRFILSHYLKKGKEIEHVVLSNVASMSLLHPNLFEPHLRIFFVFNSDPIQVKLLKLEILTNLINTSTSSIILREFQLRIGRKYSGLGLLTNSLHSSCCLTLENLVAESVVVMRKLLQMQTTDHKDVIVHIAQMVEEITVPSARASILWLLGEYGYRVPKIAPDVLRKMAKSFPKEHVAVKLQKPELSYLARNVKKILLAAKPAPVLRSTYAESIFAYVPADRPTFRLGSMSQLLGRGMAKYKELPEWPLVPPDPTTRCVNVAPLQSHTGASSDHSGQSLSISQQETEDEESIEDDEEEGVSGSEEAEAEDDENEESESDYAIKGKNGHDSDTFPTESNSESDPLPLKKIESRESLSTESSLESDEDEGNAAVIQRTKKESAPVLLLDFDSLSMPMVGSARGNWPSLGHPLIPNVVTPSSQTCPPTDAMLPGEVTIEVRSSRFHRTADYVLCLLLTASYSCHMQLSIPSHELSSPAWFFVTPAYAEPLLVEARFARTVSVFGPLQTNVELRLTNRSIAPPHRLHRLRLDTSDATAIVFSSPRPAGNLAHIVQLFTEVGGSPTPVFYNLVVSYVIAKCVLVIRILRGGRKYQRVHGSGLLQLHTASALLSEVPV
ncbi:AP-3 complex subunit beta-1 [Echinococcus granulosus]|uniref:AP-3 complex subunit beta-1 n=1 Tax=Echinococcus granulosus TaxID=6210 RepID=W6UUR1_ECHGR|nr:AP-3 complex subunit beta-1 [Echinococcus granulosus]EUB57134.1 AP-3 complex subunit beta-1 [Echinococcus granulosus]